MKKSKTRNDLLLIAAAFVVSGLIFAVLSFVQGKQTKDAVAVVTVGGSVYGKYSLTKDTVETIEVSSDAYNILEIKDGAAVVTEASCPDKICVHHASVSKKNQSIVCLPNKVVVSIENGTESDVDSVAQ